MQVRNTHQRKLICSIMEGNKNHPTADEIYELARQQDSHISRGTVYRNLHQLVEQNVLLKILVPNSSDHYDSRTDLHYHFYCECCEKIYDVPFKNEKVVDDFPLGMKRQGFKMKSCSLLFMGTCPECSKKV